MMRLKTAIHEERGRPLQTVLAMSFLALVLVAPGCQKESASKQVPEKSATSQAPPQQNQHAPEGARPGSHEDWCGGHQVPESLCTRCNASLIPAFKATGDWCKGHGLPESQCLICNPGLKIVRPPKGTGK